MLVPFFFELKTTRCPLIAARLPLPARQWVVPFDRAGCRGIQALQEAEQHHPHFLQRHQHANEISCANDVNVASDG